MRWVAKVQHWREAMYWETIRGLNSRDSDPERRCLGCGSRGRNGRRWEDPIHKACGIMRNGEQQHRTESRAASGIPTQSPTTQDLRETAAKQVHDRTHAWVSHVTRYFVLVLLTMYLRTQAVLRSVHTKHTWHRKLTAMRGGQRQIGYTIHGIGSR